MSWRRKAFLLRMISGLPFRETVYGLLQKNFGRLVADPTIRLGSQAEMARWLRQAGLPLEGMTCFEVGTGHKPIAPIGFFLTGAASVITVDLNTRLDFGLLRQTLRWMLDNRGHVESVYKDLVPTDALKMRLGLIERLWNRPEAFLEEAHIRYTAPADARTTGLPAASVDCHFSTTVMEHIPEDVIGGIMTEARRILKPQGVALHFIDPSDHFAHTDASITKVNFLSFADAEWDRLAGNPFAYCNRLRSSRYLALFESLGYEVLRSEPEVDAPSLTAIRAGLPLAESFKGLDPVDLATVTLNVMLRPRGPQ